MNNLTVATFLVVVLFVAALFVIRQHGYVATVYYLAGVLYDHATKVKAAWTASEEQQAGRWAARMNPPAPKDDLEEVNTLDNYDGSKLGSDPLIELHPRFRLLRGFTETRS